MEALRARILMDKARGEIHHELFERKLLAEKNKHTRRVAQMKQSLRKKLTTEVRWVAPDEYFEGELWPSGRINYSELHESDFPPCPCNKPHEHHAAMPDKKYWIHRRDVNRYRRNMMNAKALRELGEHTCPWKLHGSSI
jgi:hypothetical protein